MQFKIELTFVFLSCISYYREVEFYNSTHGKIFVSNNLKEDQKSGHQFYRLL